MYVCQSDDVMRSACLKPLSPVFMISFMTELASVAAVEVRELGNERSGKFSSNQFPGGFVEEAARSKEGHPNHRSFTIIINFL